MSPIGRQVPSHFSNPLGLAWRVLRSGGSAGRFTLFSTLMGIAATLLDMLLASNEHRLYRNAGPLEHSLLFVCGPPRSGTSVTAQALIRTLPVAYINNLMAAFPRAPLTASRLFGTAPNNAGVDFNSHYGKTTHFTGPNDGLFLWDRWFGNDRTDAGATMNAHQAANASQFFAALSQTYDRVVLNKNNSLIVLAARVGASLPQSVFICLERNPLYLAQSLLLARRYIHGTDRRSYGIDQPLAEHLDDPLADVCRQVAFYQRCAEKNERALGPDRFWRVSYEDFCVRPLTLVKRVAKDVLGMSLDEAAFGTQLSPFEPSQKQRLDPAEFARLRTLIENNVPLRSRA